MRIRWTAISALVLHAACSTPTKAGAGLMPSYYTVHVDYVRAGKWAQFEQARTEWATILERHKTSDERGTFLQLDDKAFLTLRGFESFAELDQRGASRAKALAAVPQEARERYDRLSEETLIPPHRSEIWIHLDDLDYRAPGPALTPTTAGVGRVVVEELWPTPDAGGEKYSEAWRALREALEKAHYPLTRVTFHSFFGSGRLITFWLASAASELEAAPSVEDAAAQVLGKAEAESLLAKIKACVAHTEEHAVRLRGDLSGRSADPKG